MGGAGPEFILMKADSNWEGGNFKTVESHKVATAEKSNDFRDPFIFKDLNAKLYLLYSSGGEKEIGVS